MARLVYASRFEVQSLEGFKDVATAYSDWFNGHYRERRSVANFVFQPTQTEEASGLPANHSLSSTLFEADAEKAIRIRWSFPDQNDPGLHWSNEARIGQFADRCSVEHLISIESIQYSVAPAKLLFGSPRVVRDICTKTPTYVGDMRIQATPYRLQRDALPDLLSLLRSDLRRLPVVVLSPYAHGQPNLIDSDQLARNLAAIAVVVQIDNPEVTWEFADTVGRQLSCFNGAARIYWPGFSEHTDPGNHRLFFGAWIEQTGPIIAARAIERAIFAVAAFRFVPDQRISNLIRVVESVERQKQLSEKKAAGDDFWKDYERDLAHLDEANTRIQELEAENANIKANQQVLIASTLGVEEVPQVPQTEVQSFCTVVDAVKEAAQRCNNIVVLETAYAGAFDSPFQRPFDIYEALTDLGEIAEVWRKTREEKGSGGDLLQHLRDRGWGKRSSMHISDTTRGKFRSHYEFDYQGQKLLFEPHITIGAGDPNTCASIHFVLDQKLGKMIIGHVGKHLPNTKT